MMFDILYYLFENYFDSGSYPDSATLTRKLTMAGFNDEDIHQALDWLSELARQDIGSYPATLADNKSFRCFSALEMENIDTEGRGFITFLEQSKIINPLQRELLIDRVIAMDEDSSSLEKIKLIVLTELWIHNQLSDDAILEKLLVVSDSHYKH
ncbi:Smg protein [Nitrosomonas aestuarii]|nr:Smg protein [Nitrosomonas aestuarii]